MPEPYWPKKKGSYTLEDAARNSTHARLRCRYCKTERYYLVEELAKVFGASIECDDVTLRHKWRCRKCGLDGTIEMNLENPPAAKLQVMKLRRLDRIEYVRRVHWRDESS